MPFKSITRLKISKSAKTMPRPEIKLEYKEKIAHLMLNDGVNKAPFMSQLIEDWAISNGWDDYPAERTVSRWMGRVREGEIGLLAKRKLFNWPQDMGEEEEKIGWEHSKTALQCLRFYLEGGYGRPSVGITQWFARVAQVDDSSNIQKKALFAEMFWLADILEHTHNFKRPSTTEQELNLAFETSELGSLTIEKILDDYKIQTFSIPKKALRFAEDLPIFGKELRKIRENK